MLTGSVPGHPGCHLQDRRILAGTVSAADGIRPDKTRMFQMRGGDCSMIGNDFNAERIPDSALDKIVGGADESHNKEGKKELYCKKCHKKTMFIIYSGGRGYCTECKTRQNV